MTIAYATNTEDVAEIVPGVLRRLRDCTVADLDLARETEGRKTMLRVEAEVLIARAAESNVELSDELRERTATWSGLLPDLEALVNELRSAVLQTA